LLKVEPGTQAPVHWHIGTAEAFILEGGFFYFEDDKGFPGAYTAELGGAIHQPVSPAGCVMLAVAHGPISGFNPDGSIAGVCDARMMYELACKANAADHVVRMGLIAKC
jgi:2,4'-dihydroxyacetophenone dioxygenase